MTLSCHHPWGGVACDISASPQIYRYYSTLSYVPIILCLVLLSLWYPALLIRSFTRQEETSDKEVMKIHEATREMVAWEKPLMDLHGFGSSPAPQPICLPRGPGELGFSEGTCSPLCSGAESCLPSIPLTAWVMALFILLDLKRE